MWKPEYNNNRMIIPVSLNHSEQVLFNKIYGVKPTGKHFKTATLNNKVSILTIKKDISKDNLVLQLKKIGNNINQIAWSLNVNPDVLSEQQKEMLTFSLEQVSNLIQKYEN